MTDDFRALLRDDLAERQEPQLGSLVQDSLREGKRMRTIRRLYQAGALGAACAVLAGAVGAHAELGGSRPATAIAPAAQATAKLTPSTSKAATTSKATTTASAPGAVTSEALLKALLADLPAGKTSHYSKFKPDPASNPTDIAHQPIAQAGVELDSGHGPGLISLSVATQKQLADYRKLVKHYGGSATSWKLPDGRTVTALTNPTVCQQAKTISVDRSDGLVVQVDLGTCLVRGTTLDPHGRIALTQAQAIKIADDSRIGA
jgi:hypothetical protein